MGAAYDAVLAALPQLTPDERVRVVERIKAMGALAPSSPQVGAAGGDADVFLGTILDVVLRMSGERGTPAVLRRSRAFPAFRDKAAEVARFIARHADTRARRAALLTLGVELLYADLQRGGFTVTARTLMSCAHQVPAVLDKSFPGYAQSGLLGMVVGTRVESGE